MPNMTQRYLPDLRSHRLPGLDLGGDFVYPDYDGRSILNLPSTVCRLLGVPEIAHAPLREEMLAPLEGNIRRVVLILLDALGLHLLERWLGGGNLPVWQRLIEQGALYPLTSIAPSTTSAALSSLWTGRSATEHGIMGYEMWMKEYGVVANTILHAPITFQGESGTLRRAGFDPKTYLPFPTLGSHLADHGVKTYAMQNYSILDSGLSEMFFQDVDVSGFSTATDLWINLRRTMEDNPAERAYCWVYFGEVDHFAHVHGPDDERVEEEFASLSANFERLLLNQLSSAARRDTLLILTADHGQIATRPDPHYDLRNHPGLTRRLHILPNGETRMAYLFVKPGQTEAVREYLERTWPNQFAVLDSGYAVETGLFGPGKPHPFLLDRLGEYIVIGRGSAYLWWAAKNNHMIGRHGGLHPQEMLVPFLAARLDG